MVTASADIWFTVIVCTGTLLCVTVICVLLIGINTPRVR